MSQDSSLLNRVSFLEKENYELRIELDRVLSEFSCFRLKYDKLCAYSKALEDFIRNIGSNFFRFKGKESPLLDMVERDPALEDIGCKFKDEWISKHPKPILESVPEEEEEEEEEKVEEEEEPNKDREPFYEEGYIQNIVRFEDFGMNEDDFDDVNYYFSDIQMDEIKKILGPHFETMKKNSHPTDYRVSYNARKEAAFKALDDLHLKAELTAAIEEFGWNKIYSKELTPIVNIILEEQNIIIEDPAKPNLHLCKIANLVLSVLQNINSTRKCCQALFLVPSRELAMKVHRVVKALGKHLNITSYVCINGATRYKQDIKMLSEGIHVLIGTPGRILDLIKQRTLSVTKIKSLTIGDAVELLTGTFAYQTKTIFLNLPEDKQVVLLTTGSNQEVTKFCDSFMKIRKVIPIEETLPNLVGLKQYYLNIEYRDTKWRPLMDIRNLFPNIRMVVICNSHQRVVEWLTYQMRQKGETVLAAPATMEPAEREVVLKGFSLGNVPTLITTELLLNTADIQLQDVDLLVNYELPILPQNYYDRISFCGRDFEKRGMVINFVAGKNRTQLQLQNKIAQFCDTEIVPIPITDED